jgi:hypothetical protein
LFEADIEIGYNNAESKNLLDFLFLDLPPTGKKILDRHFDVLMVGKPAKISLWLGEEKYYHGESKYDLAYILINEIIYSCITNNRVDHAIHAAAISIDGQGILFPGKSGSGKSSLAAWLTASGGDYLTDELALISQDGTIKSFTRPISLKTQSFELLTRHYPLNQDDLLIGEKGAMIPHRSLQPRSTGGASAHLDMIIFPRFVKDHTGSLQPLSEAQSCMKIMECFVNARNMCDHGFHQIAKLAKRAKSYDLLFGSFGAITSALQTLFPSIS